MLPALPAQIHVPDVTSPRPERLAAARAAAGRALGLGLVIGAPFVVLVTLSEDARATAAVIPCVWLVAGAGAIAAFIGKLSATGVVLQTPSRASRALLFAGLALLGPLTLHLALQAHRWAPNEWLHLVDGPVSFAKWMWLSLLLAGPSHIVFAGLCAIRGFSGRPGLVVIGAAATAAALYCCVLWGLFGLLPVAYVGVTSVPLLLLMRRLERAPPGARGSASGAT